MSHRAFRVEGSFANPCVANSEFYNLEALRPYKWYWRLEPSVRYSCALTYDPFAEMARRNKVYGWTIALWEVGDTCPPCSRRPTTTGSKRAFPGRQPGMPCSK